MPSYRCSTCSGFFRPCDFPVDENGNLSRKCMACTVKMIDKEDGVASGKKEYWHCKTYKDGKSWSSLTTKEKSEEDPERYKFYLEQEAQRRIKHRGRICSRCEVVKIPSEFPRKKYINGPPKTVCIDCITPEEMMAIDSDKRALLKAKKERYLKKLKEER